MAQVILVVEDEPMNRKLIRDVLQTAGYETIEASNGREGIELAQSRKPDLILMDILMPKMNGYEACQAIKANKATRAIPVIMLTALDQRLNMAIGREMGADGYITKPFDVKELVDEISRLLPLS